MNRLRIVAKEERGCLNKILGKPFDEYRVIPSIVAGAGELRGSTNGSWSQIWGLCE